MPRQVTGGVPHYMRPRPSYHGDYTAIVLAKQVIATHPISQTINPTVLFRSDVYSYGGKRIVTKYARKEYL